MWHIHTELMGTQNTIAVSHCHLFPLLLLQQCPRMAHIFFQINGNTHNKGNNNNTTNRMVEMSSQSMLGQFGGRKQTIGNVSSFHVFLSIMKNKNNNTQKVSFLPPSLYRHNIKWKKNNKNYIHKLVEIYFLSSPPSFPSTTPLEKARLEELTVTFPSRTHTITIFFSPKYRTSSHTYHYHFW